MTIFDPGFWPQSGFWPLTAYIGLVLLLMIFIRLGTINRQLAAFREAKEQQFNAMFDLVRDIRSFSGP